MKNKKRALLVILAATLLLASTVMGTMAWLYATDNTADQTFDAGELGVSITYNDYDPTNEEYAEDATDNELVPGKTFAFAPTVTVAPKSEETYIRVLVTITGADDLVALMGTNLTDATDGNEILLPHLFVGGWDAAKWTHANINSSNYTKYYKKAENKLVYEFRYFETVKTEKTGIELIPVFESFTLPTNLDNAGIAAIAEGLSIDFTVQAIQAHGLETADAAWAAYEAQVG